MLVDYKSTIEGKDQRLPLTSDFFQTLDAGYDFEHRFTAWGEQSIIACNKRNEG